MVELTGYHGTNKNNGQMILSTKNFIPSGTFKDWLGRGVYFFEEDKHQAYMFSKFKDYPNVLEHNDICVIEALLKFENDNYINLLCDDDRKFLKEYAEKIKEQIENKKEEIGDWEHKEGFVLDFLYDNDSKYDLVKAAYMVPKKQPDKILEYMPMQIQICVKNVSCINKESIHEVNCDAYERV